MNTYTTQAQPHTRTHIHMHSDTHAHTRFLPRLTCSLSVCSLSLSLFSHPAFPFQHQLAAHAGAGGPQKDRDQVRTDACLRHAPFLRPAADGPPALVCPVPFSTCPGPTLPAATADATASNPTAWTSLLPAPTTRPPRCAPRARVPPAAPTTRTATSADVSPPSRRCLVYFFPPLLGGRHCTRRRRTALVALAASLACRTR